MRFFTARRLALAAVLPVLFTFTIIPGCSEESEGERCGDATTPDDSDCQSGLVCTQIDSSHGIFRCCNPARVTNSRCVPVAPSGSTAGAGGGAGLAGVGGSAGGGASGIGGTSDGAGAAGASAGQSTATDAGASGAGG